MTAFVAYMQTAEANSLLRECLQRELYTYAQILVLIPKFWNKDALLHSAGAPLSLIKLLLKNVSRGSTELVTVMVNAGRADALALLDDTDFCSYHVPMAFQLDSDEVYDAVLGRLRYADPDASCILDSYTARPSEKRLQAWLDKLKFPYADMQAFLGRFPDSKVMQDYKTKEMKRRRAEEAKRKAQQKQYELWQLKEDILNSLNKKDGYSVANVSVPIFYDGKLNYLHRYQLMHTQTGPFGPTANNKKNLLAQLREKLDWVKVIQDPQEIDNVKLESLDDDVYCSKRTGLSVRLLTERKKNKKVRYYMEPMFHEVVYNDIVILTEKFDNVMELPKLSVDHKLFRTHFKKVDGLPITWSSFQEFSKDVTSVCRTWKPFDKWSKTVSFLFKHVDALPRNEQLSILDPESLLPDYVKGKMPPSVNIYKNTFALIDTSWGQPWRQRTVEQRSLKVGCTLEGPKGLCWEVVKVNKTSIALRWRMSDTLKQDVLVINAVAEKNKDFPFTDLTPGSLCLNKEVLDQFKISTQKVSWSRANFDAYSKKVFKFYESKMFSDSQGESLLCCKHFELRSAAITDALRWQSKEDILGDKVHLFIGSSWEHKKNSYVKSKKINWHVRVGDAWHKDDRPDSYIVKKTSPTTVKFFSSEGKKEQVMNINKFVKDFKIGTLYDVTDSETDDDLPIEKYATWRPRIAGKKRKIELSYAGRPLVLGQTVSYMSKKRKTSVTLTVDEVHSRKLDKPLELGGGIEVNVRPVVYDRVNNLKRTIEVLLEPYHGVKKRCLLPGKIECGLN
jgi:hypothetical protein